jgi:hypothetical protein
MYASWHGVPEAMIQDAAIVLVSYRHHLYHTVAC